MWSEREKLETKGKECEVLEEKRVNYLLKDVWKGQKEKECEEPKELEIKEKKSAK